MKIRDLIKSQPVEPVIFLGFYANILQTFLFQSITLDSARVVVKERNFYYFNHTNPYEKSNVMLQETTIQNEAAKWTLYSNLSFGLVSFFISNFYGFIADRRSHSKCLIILLTGNFVVSLLLFVRLCIKSSRHILIFVVIVQSLSGLFGGPIVLMSMTTGYISEVSIKQENTGRFSILEGIGCLAVVLAQGTGGKVIDNLKFYYIVVLIAVPNGISLIYTILLFFKFSSAANKNKRQTHENDECPTQNSRRFFCRLFRASDKAHIVLILILNSIVILSVSIMGANALLYLYLRKSPISFTNTEYGVYSACSQLLNGIGLLLILTQMKKIFINEMLLCCISVFLRIVTYVIIAFARNRTVIYISLCLAILCGYESPIMRAVALRQVKPSDEGKLSGLLASIQSLGFLLGLSVFPKVYMITLDYFPGTVFIACSVMIALALVLLVFALYFELKQTIKRGKLILKNIIFTVQRNKNEKPDKIEQNLLRSVEK